MWTDFGSSHCECPLLPSFSPSASASPAEPLLKFRGTPQGGFAAQANGWQWPIYELLWISAFAFIVLAFFLPETSGETILIRRAERLRRLTGNPLIKTQYELDRKESETVLSLATESFVRAMRLSVEPAPLFAHVYISLVYAILYLWFEAFPIVFHDLYQFNLGMSGLVFVAFVVSAVFTVGSTPSSRISLS